MARLRAGFGSAEISPAPGARLVGYAHRRGPAEGQRDPLAARTLVIELGADRLALAVLELCYVGEDVVAELRDAVAGAVGIEPNRVLIAATHTHSGPHDADPRSWPDGLASRVAAAAGQAAARLEPARIGVGWGAIRGRSLNRRRLEDPVDPAVAVVRVDTVAGRPLGVLFSFGCHPVVLGPDNLLASGDWPGHAARTLEARLGEGAVAIFAQAGGADVNPLTSRLGSHEAIVATTPNATYYGSAADSPRSVGDRTGGSFAEMAALGEAVADEVERVHRGVAPRHHAVTLRVRNEMIDLGGSRPIATASGPPHTIELPRSGPERPLEIMVVEVREAGLMLVAQPGEVFAESAVRLRRELRGRGVEFPLTISHANGWRGYLPPASAYRDGGYEVEWARAVGIGRWVQEDVLALSLAAAARA